MWVDKWELYAKYHAHQNPEAKEFVDSKLATAKTMKDPAHPKDKTAKLYRVRKEFSEGKSEAHKSEVGSKTEGEIGTAEGAKAVEGWVGTFGDNLPSAKPMHGFKPGVVPDPLDADGKGKGRRRRKGGYKF